MRSVRSDLTQFGFNGSGGSGGLVTRIEALEDNVELLEDDVDKAFSQMNYSTQEHIVGEWIDGKALYSKTIECINSVDISDLNYDTILIKDGIHIGSGDYSGQFFPLSSNTQAGYIITQIHNNNLVVQAVAFTISKSYITLLYTKNGEE